MEILGILGTVNCIKEKKPSEKEQLGKQKNPHTHF
jgi:hypothetical protein